MGVHSKGSWVHYSIWRCSTDGFGSNCVYYLLITHWRPMVGSSLYQIIACRLLGDILQEPMKNRISIVTNYVSKCPTHISLGVDAYMCYNIFEEFGIAEHTITRPSKSQLQSLVHITCAIDNIRFRNIVIVTHLPSMLFMWLEQPSGVSRVYENFCWIPHQWNAPNRLVVSLFNVIYICCRIISFMSMTWTVCPKMEPIPHEIIRAKTRAIDWVC